MRRDINIKTLEVKNLCPYLDNELKNLFGELVNQSLAENRFLKTNSPYLLDNMIAF